MTVRWVFQDMSTSETATVEINPNEMNTPTIARNIQFAQGTRYGTGRVRGYESPPPAPASWTFSGVIISQTHYEMLEDWSDRDVLLQITDHLGRTFQVLIESFDVTERLPTASKPWRAHYTMNCLLLREV